MCKKGSCGESIACVASQACMEVELQAWPRQRVRAHDGRQQARCVAMRPAGDVRTTSRFLSALCDVEMLMYGAGGRARRRAEATVGTTEFARCVRCKKLIK